MDKQTDPVIVDLLTWLKDNLPPDTDETAIFKNVKKMQKIFDLLIGLSFEEFYNHTAGSEELVTEKLKEMKDYISLNEEKLMKTRKLDASRAKLEIKREQYTLINSIRLNGCRDLISRYNHLMSKK